VVAPPLALLVAPIGGASDLFHPGGPPWFNWVEDHPQAAEWVTTNSESVNWTPNYENWVRAAKFILYVFPVEHPTRDVTYVQACHEVYDVWAGATSLFDLYSQDTMTLPNFGRVNWSSNGDVSEGTFYEWVKTGRQWGKPYSCDWKPCADDEMIKAAVRIAYWVASWVPYGWYDNYRNGGHPENVLKYPWMGWNCCDHAALAVALMRAAGIPARPVLGGPGGNDHAWVEVYDINGNWVPVDPTGNAGARYCRPYFRSGWISGYDFENGVNHHAITVESLSNCWNNCYIGITFHPYCTTSAATNTWTFADFINTIIKAIVSVPPFL